MSDRVVIAGGTGFLGRPLAESLAAEGHDVVLLTRRSPAAAAGRIRATTWSPDGSTGAWASEVDGAGAVINLAGESIAKRWTASQKQRILDSRVLATRSIVAAIRNAGTAPAVLINASAVGYYGPHGDDVVTEETHGGDDFLAHVCIEWESEAADASDRTRVVCVRTGLPLAKDGGALQPMLPPFRLGVGGPVGTGRQYWPWIHRDDWLALVRWSIEHDRIAGALNATAPNPVTNAEFARTLGRALHRPAIMPAPAFALRLLLGEMADGLLLSGQRAVPAKAEHAGFGFKYSRLDDALNAIFSGS